MRTDQGEPSYRRRTILEGSDGKDRRIGVQWATKFVVKTDARKLKMYPYEMDKEEVKFVNAPQVKLKLCHLLDLKKVQ